VRLSRDDNGEKIDSIETQKSLLVSFAEKNLPGKPVRIYVDDNISGVTFERPALKRFTDDARHGAIDTLILKDLSRLGRSNARTLLFLEETELLGVRIITADGRYDSEKNFELAGIDSWFNERYVVDISRKIRSNIKQKIESGQYIGTAPYGYRKKAGDTNRLEPDPLTAPIVQDIFNLYISGYGYKKIADILDMRGILPPSPSRSKSMKWNPVTIKRILSNRVYLGTTIQGISRKVSFKSKKTCRLPADMWTVTDGTHEPLVASAVWQQAEATSTGRRTAQASLIADRPSGVPAVNLFRSALRCGYCGGPMIQRISQGRPAAYICARYAKHGAAYCRRNSVRRDFLLKTVAEAIAVITDKAIATQGELNKKVTEDRPEALCIMSKAVCDTAQRELLKRKQEIVYNDYLDGKISEDLFRRMNDIIEKKINASTGDDHLNCVEKLSGSSGVCGGKKDGVAPVKILERLKFLTELVRASGFNGFKEFFGENHYCEKVDAINQNLFKCAVQTVFCSISVTEDSIEFSTRYKFNKIF